MTPAERETLLKLWEDCPEVQPDCLCFNAVYGWYFDAPGRGVVTLPVVYAAAIARDAMVQWLITQSMRIGMKCVLGAKLFDGTSVQYSAWNHGPNGRNQGQGDGDTLLLALVATCRKIAGKDSA